MDVRNKATRIDLFSLRTPQMRSFHMTWFAFFLCFFAWFGIAPLMAIVRDELGLSKTQIGNTIIASVAITIVARLFIGWLCDHIGPRISYTILLLLGSLPVMGIGLAHSYESFLLFRLGIGVIGASFVITQYHTSVMFAPNFVGTANATSAGWVNLGGRDEEITCENPARRRDQHAVPRILRDPPPARTRWRSHQRGLRDDQHTVEGHPR